VSECLRLSLTSLILPCA